MMAKAKNRGYLPFKDEKELGGVARTAPTLTHQTTSFSSELGRDARVEKKAGSGASIDALLLLCSPLFRALNWMVNQLEGYVGGSLVKLRVPRSVGAVGRIVREVEGAEFAITAEPNVADAFRMLCAQANADPLNLAGKMFVQKLMDRSAIVRHQVYAHLYRNPSVKSIAVLPPVFIVGLPRTGSTHLQSLMACDSNAATIKMWEMMQPLPLCEPDSLRAHSRQISLELTKSLMGLMAPGWNAATDKFHHVNMNSPEEEAVLLAGCGVSLMPYVCIGKAESEYQTMHGDPASKAAMFRYLRRFLQMLETTRAAPGGTRWVLKSHYNALWMDTLLDEFPGARIVITVRDPIEVIQSFISYSIACLSFIAKEGEGPEVRPRHAPRAAGRGHSHCARPDSFFFPSAAGEGPCSGVIRVPCGKRKGARPLASGAERQGQCARGQIPAARQGPHPVHAGYLQEL